MKEVFSIGIVKGVFDIFIPGAFLLINLLGTLAVFQPGILDSPAASQAQGTGAQAEDLNGELFSGFVSNPLLGTVAFVCFSYLAGMVLRLTKVKWADRASAWLNRICGLKVKKVHLTERFPYIEYLGDIAKERLPRDAYDFYVRYWKPRNPQNLGETMKDNRNFFNFCKTIINSVDARSAAEANTAEALSRYVASMFYALGVSTLLMIAICVRLRSLLPSILLGSYLLAIVWILGNLRLLRFKEAEALFAATFLNRDRLPWLPLRSGPLGKKAGP